MPRPNNSVAARGRQQKGYIASLYAELRSPENSSAIKAVAVFGVAVALLQSGWGEMIIPA